MAINFPGWVIPLILLGLLALCFIYYVLARKYGEKLALVRFVRGNIVQLWLAVLVFVFVVLAVVPVFVVTIPYGNSAVVWKRFEGGTDIDKVFDEGSVLIFPWNKAYLYNTKYQTIEHEFTAVTAKGLETRLSMILRFRVLHDSLHYLHVSVGTDYINLMILPEIGSWARMVVSKRTAEEVYATHRLEVQREIYQHLTGSVDTLLHVNEGSTCELTIVSDGQQHDNCAVKDYFEIQDLLIHDIGLPPGVKESIVSKIKKTHLVEEYDYLIQIAEKEALRKEKEAEGIAKFQNIVTGGISDTYLRWRGIEATLELAKSENSKVVVIGGGKDGLPIILNAESSISGAQPLISANTEDANSEKDNPEEQKKATQAKVEEAKECDLACQAEKIRQKLPMN